MHEVRLVLLLLLLVLHGGTTVAQDDPPLDLKKMFQDGIPRSPFIAVVYRYADTMIQHGRDTQGPKHTGLFLGALDRRSLRPLDARPSPPAGVNEEDRPGAKGGSLTGANLQLDQNLLRLLYFLAELSGDSKYSQAADQELSWFLENAAASDTGWLPWEQYWCWDTATDQVVSSHPTARHARRGPWMLWDACYRLNTAASQRFARGLLTAHAVDGERRPLAQSALFSPTSKPDAATSASSPQQAAMSARHAGFFLRSLADAYSQSTDDDYLRAIESLAGPWFKEPAQEESTTDLPSLLSLAIDAEGAARKVPEPLRSRLRHLAVRLDDEFCTAPHEIADQGFACRARQGDSPAAAYSARWRPADDPTTAAIGVMCMSRYENCGRVAYRDMLVAAADRYFDSLPADGVDAWPLTFGQAITLELAAYRATSQRRYFDRAHQLGEIAVDRFFGDNPLPRASLKSDHYENTTGAGTLALALAELHLLTLDITAVRAPMNTLDR